MRCANRLMRRALLAALTALPLPALAEPTALFDEASGAVIVTGLPEDERAQVLSDRDALRLQVASLDTTRGMPVTLEERDAGIIVTPRFALRAGTAYVLNIAVGGGLYRIDMDLPAPDAAAPVLTGFAPSQAVIPANALRIYLQFSEPMARGQLRETVTLMASDGSEVISPFLDLETELWDPSQTRATLLLDPGRIKQGVGPNLSAGAPLIPGERYHLVVSSRMQSAAGLPMATDATLTFRAGPPERRPIDPARWQILPPAPGSLAPLTIAFDRIMDSGAILRLLVLNDAQGNRVQGRIASDGGGWSIIPERAWRHGDYHLSLDPRLEDVSGNTPAAPFDAAPGTIGTGQIPTILTIRIGA